MRRSAQPGEAGESERVEDPTGPTLPVADEFSSGMVTLEHSPAALGLATLAGDLVYLNSRGARLFGVPQGAPLTGRNLADLCEDPGQLASLEAVARDGRERSLHGYREVHGAPPRRFLCKLTRIPGYGGIPTWLAFAGVECGDSSTDDDAPLGEAESMSIIRRLTKVVAWKMRIDPRDRQTPNMMQWDPGIQPLLNLRPGSSRMATDHFLDFVAREDRELVREALQESLQDGRRLEVVYRVNPRSGSPKIVLSRAVVVPAAEGSSVPTMLGTVEDITSALGNEMRSYEKAAILETIAANMEGPVYAVDRDLRYTYFNPFFAFMLRRIYGADPVLGEKAYETVSDDSRRRVVLGHLRRALAGARVVEEVPVSVDDDAIVRRYELTYSPLRTAAAGGGVAVFGIRSPGAATSR